MIKNGDIKIMGYYFKMENVQTDTSFEYHSMNTTKIFNGTEINTMGEWNGVQFSFDTYIPIKYEQRNKYDKIFKKMMSKPVEVITKDFDGLHYAQVIIKKQLNNGSPDGLDLNISVREIPITSDYYPDTDISNVSRARLIEE